MRKIEREAHILREARKMAKSREYQNHRSIEIKLRSVGFSEARQVLDNSFVRKELNALCGGKDPYA